MSSFKTIISHCGVIHIAKAAKISPRAVYKWLARDCLPRTEFTGETNYSGSSATCLAGLIRLMR